MGMLYRPREPVLDCLELFLALCFHRIVLGEPECRDKPLIARKLPINGIVYVLLITNDARHLRSDHKALLRFGNRTLYSRIIAREDTERIYAVNARDINSRICYVTSFVVSLYHLIERPCLFIKKMLYYSIFHFASRKREQMLAILLS